MKRQNSISLSTIPPPGRRFCIVIIFALTSLFAFCQTWAAGVDYWMGAGPDANWSTDLNWLGGVKPGETGHDDVVMLGPGRINNTADTGFSGGLPRRIVLNSLVFPTGAPTFVVHIMNMAIEGGYSNFNPSGIINSSGKLQILQIDAAAAFEPVNGLSISNTLPLGDVLVQNNGQLILYQTSAGTSTIQNFTYGQTTFNGGTAGAASIANYEGGSTSFFGGSAGSATIHNIGASGPQGFGGETSFSRGAEAGTATIVNEGASSAYDWASALTSFRDYANAENATITNNAGTAHGGGVIFSQQSYAGNALIVNNGSGALGQAGHTAFYDTSSAGQATIVNKGGDQFFGHGGTTTFHSTADAGNATLIAQGGAPATNNGIPIPGGLGGRIFFNDHSTGGTADVQVLGNGAVDISGHAASGVTIGSLEGDGQAYLGANTLSVGSSNSNIVFWGSLHDGGESGGTGGSFAKVGSGTFTLAGRSDYTGATTVTWGNLIVDGDIASSSGVTVNSGATLGGYGIVGKIGGAGTVAPGNSPGILTATQVDPSGGLAFDFQLTRVGSPVYGSAAASGNDLLHLTGATPFTSFLNSANQITVDFSGASLADGQIYLGGFFTDSAVDSAILNGATFLYLGLNGYDVRFDGLVTEALADFAGGSVRNGEVMKFEIGTDLPVTPVPEPSAYGLLSAIGLAILACKRRRSGYRRSICGE